MSEQTFTPVPLVERRPRPNGQPARCAVCGRVCLAAVLGDPLCKYHLDERSRKHGAFVARTANRKTSQSRPVFAVIPVAAPSSTTTDPLSLRERLKARRQAAGGNERI